MGLPCLQLMSITTIICTEKHFLIENDGTNGGEVMIEVIIDYGITNEWIATFADEKTYMACLPALEKYAEVNRGKIVESVQ